MMAGMITWVIPYIICILSGILVFFVMIFNSHLSILLILFQFVGLYEAKVVLEEVAIKAKADHNIQSGQFVSGAWNF